MSWGFGSRQQIVTAIEEPGFDSNCLWIVKPSHKLGVTTSVQVLQPLDDGGKFDNGSISAGSSVHCGDIVRLEHMETEKNLHSHEQSAAIAGSNYEICGYGRSGTGDAGDNFKVECSGSVWMLSEAVGLKHNDLNSFLVTSKSSLFTHSNCPRCPIVGHQEVSVQRSPSSWGRDVTQWTAEPGLLVARLDEDEEAGNGNLKDEL